MVATAAAKHVWMTMSTSDDAAGTWIAAHVPRSDGLAERALVHVRADGAEPATATMVVASHDRAATIPHEREEGVEEESPMSCRVADDKGDGATEEGGADDGDDLGDGDNNRGDDGDNADGEDADDDAWGCTNGRRRDRCTGDCNRPPLCPVACELSDSPVSVHPCNPAKPGVDDSAIPPSDAT